MRKVDFDNTPEWEKVFSRVRFNAIYFIEEYWNVVHPDKKVELTKEEKQEIFNRYKATPFFSDFSQVESYNKRIKELKEQGYEDWEII